MRVTQGMKTLVFRRGGGAQPFRLKLPSNDSTHLTCPFVLFESSQPLRRATMRLLRYFNQELLCLYIVFQINNFLIKGVKASAFQSLR